VAVYRLYSFQSIYCRNFCWSLRREEANISDIWKEGYSVVGSLAFQGIT
jgi:hypothetical protein